MWLFLFDQIDPDTAIFFGETDTTKVCHECQSYEEKRAHVQRMLVPIIATVQVLCVAKVIDKTKVFSVKATKLYHLKLIIVRILQCTN